jgi:titin
MVQGNFIGLTADGTAAIANGFVDPAHHVFYGGIDIFGGAQNNLIGGSVAGAGNVISGNAGAGVTVSQANTNGNTIQGNFIGTNSNGTSALGNGFADPAHGFLFQGVAIFGGAQSTLVGGTSAASANLISGNASQGVFIGDATTMLNVVQGNIIGLTAAGSGPLANGSSGVGIFTGATSNTIGGVSEGARNVISGNFADGVTIGSSGTSANTVQGNFIGLNPAGTSAMANAGAGVAIFSSTNNTVGGTIAGARNYISGNSAGGVVISAAATTGNLVQGNTIGLTLTGTAAGNGNVGVSIFGGAQSNTIGGSASGAGNIITASGNQGIGVFDETGTPKDTFKNAFSRNTVFANGAKGIGLFNGANNGLLPPTLGTPVLGSASNLSGTDVSGSAPASSNVPLTIEFFASPTADPSGSGEGQFFIGSTSVGTSGGVFGVISLGAAVPAGYVVSATATDSLGNTSEFAVNKTVTSTDSDMPPDGIPDNWTNAHFGHATGMAGDKSLATDDADGDGMTNAQEFMAGLDPRNPNSVLRITSVTKSAGNVLIGFPSVTGKVYQLQFRDDLVAGNWNPLVDGILGTGATLQISDPSNSGLTKRFYRIALGP